MLRPGGLMVIDNVLWDGNVARPGISAPETDSLRALNSAAPPLLRGEPVMRPWRSGSRPCLASPGAFEVRALFRGNGVTVEDPVCGSFNASLARWLLAADLVRARWWSVRPPCWGDAAGCMSAKTTTAGSGSAEAP